MFRKNNDEPAQKLEISSSMQRVTSVLGAGMTWKGSISGKGGVRIEGAFEGKIKLQGLIVVDKKGRVNSDLIQAQTVIVAGTVHSDIQAQKVEIRSTGRVWGDVTTEAFSTEEGGFLRGKIQMEESVILDPEAEEDQGKAEEDPEPSEKD
jgi:cytoskeletal protein CcmA (bactofilin family)